MASDKHTGLTAAETRFATFPDGLKLASGELLAPVTLAYEIYGELNDAKDNAILVFHALTGSQHAAGFNPAVSGVAKWTDECKLGWWHGFVGPGLAFDTARFAVICVNYLGGCYGSTGPASVDPSTGTQYGSTFPQISIADIVDSQMLLLDELGIRTLYAATGASIGGLMCLSLATRFPDRISTVIPIAAGLRVTTLQIIHNFEQSNAIINDPNFNGGDFYDGPTPDAGLALARMIGHKTFVSLPAMEERARREIIPVADQPAHYEIHTALESYMWHQGAKFVKRFDANSYLLFMKAWQTFDLVADAGAATMQEVLERCTDQRFMTFSIDSDVCYYPEEQEEMVQELKAAGVTSRRITVHSDKGHDSFLLEPELFAPYLRDTLINWG